MAIEIDNDNDEIRIDGYEYAGTKVKVKTYSISSEFSQAPNSANIRITDNDGYTDAVRFAGGQNVTIIRTDQDTITISANDVDTNTTYSISAEINATPKSADLRLTGSDASTDNVTLVGGTNVNVVRTDQNTLTINSSQPAFGTMSDGNISAVADQANDTFTFVAGTGIGVLVNGPADSITISNTGVTAITAGTAITTSGSGNVTVNNDGVTTFNTAKGAITYNSFGTMSDGTNTAVADLANDTFSFAAGTGIGVLVSAASDNVTISNTGVTSLNGGTGARYTYSTFTDGTAPTTASLGNTTMTLTGTDGIKVTTSPNTATVSMTETSKILGTTETISVSPSAPNTFFNIANMSANSAVEIRGIILLRFSGGDVGNTFSVTLATNGTFTHAGVDLQVGPQNAEVTSNVTGFTSAAFNNANVHTLWFSGVIVNGGTTATPSLNIGNNSAQSSLDILAKSFIKYNYI